MPEVVDDRLEDDALTVRRPVRRIGIDAPRRELPGVRTVDVHDEQRLDLTPVPEGSVLAEESDLIHETGAVGREARRGVEVTACGPRRHGRQPAQPGSIGAY